MLTSDYSKIPVSTLESLSQYVEHHRRVGGFLEAVLSNDLIGAFARADEPNKAALWAIVSYCQFELEPGQCWGSASNYQNWINDWEPPHRDLDVIDLENDQGLRDLENPWER